MPSIEVLVDSDAFVGRFYTKDAHHERAKRGFSTLEKRGSAIATTSLVISEVATVLSHRSGQELARKYLDVMERSKLPVIHIDENLQGAALELFKKETARGTSVTDCANVVVVKRFEIPALFSFDKFYTKRFGLKAVV